MLDGMKAYRRPFGAAEAFTLEGAGGVSAEVISFGAAIRSVRMPGKDGGVSEITYGFDTLEEYEAKRRFFGASIGRAANRIARGAFTLGGAEFTLARNERGVNHLHGGECGFDRRLWRGELREGDGEASVTFSLRSPAGEEGYPGNLDARVTYTLTDGGASEGGCGQLIIDYAAEADAMTPFNPTNHTFWNLSGGREESVLMHELELNCPFFLPVDADLIPTGEVRSVSGTAMDFSRAKPLGRDIEGVVPDGYDHCFVIAPGRRAVRRAARLFDRGSARALEVFTDMPGIQVYSGNHIRPERVSGGRPAVRRGAVCLETEFFPDAVNRPHFPQGLAGPGRPFSSRTVLRFSLAL